MGRQLGAPGLGLAFSLAACAGPPRLPVPPPFHGQPPGPPAQVGAQTPAPEAPTLPTTPEGPMFFWAPACRSIRRRTSRHKPAAATW